jgi:ferrochelatase
MEDVLFIRALADRVRAAEEKVPDPERKDAHWLFTAHSIPVAADHASRYADQVRRAAGRVADLCGHSNWTLCFQSRSGRPEDPWLEPDVSDVLTELSGSRSRSVLLIPIGFLVDHVEVLYDLDVKARKAAEEAKLRFHRASTVGDHPAFLELLSLRTAHALGAAGAPRTA